MLLTTLLLGCSPVATLKGGWDETDDLDITLDEAGAGDTDTALIADDTGGGGVDTEPPPPVPPTLTVSAPPAWDPIAGGELSVSIGADVDGEMSLTLYDPGGAKLWSLDGALLAGVPADLSWDGEAVYGVGAHRLEVTYLDTETGLDASAEREVQVVRCGVSDVWAEDDGGETALRVPLYWHISRTLQDVSYPISSLSALEDADGAPLDLPAVSDDLDVHAGEGMIEPTAWRWDSRPILSLELGGDTVLGGHNLDDGGIALSIEGWTVLNPGPLVAGEYLLLQRDAPLADFLGVIEEQLTLSFTAMDLDGEEWLVAEQALPMRMYALHDAPTFVEEGEVYHPWVAAIDAALRAIDGVDPDAEAVLDALVEWVFNDLGLTYDTRSGASAYTTYRRGWDSGHFYFTDFLERRFGEVVNCSDCASILTGYANMLGARLSYLIILQNFSLNEILAIGQDDYTSCPFGPNSCGFSYHAVTTMDGGERIWDATLALDGDEDPGASPYDVLPVTGVDGEEYLDRLVRSGNASYNYETNGTIQ